jgi:hypothetical protein
MAAGAVSIAFHGGLLSLVIVVAGKHVAPSPPPALIPVEIVVPAAPPPLPQPAPPPPHAAPARRPAASATANAGAHARREPIQRSPSSEPASVKALADLKISYNDPTNFADARTGTKADLASGAGRAGIGAGVDPRLASGLTNLEIPQPAGPSLARPPRPKRDYRDLRILGASKFAGQTIKIQLSIDVHGRVRTVQLLHGVERDLDRKTIALVHDFEYNPALDDDGTPIPGTSRWDFQIVADEDDAPFESPLDLRH